jgi:hypothetical protein
MRQRNLGILGATLIVLGFAMNVVTGVVAANVTGGHTPAAITRPGGDQPPGPQHQRPGGGFFGPGGSGQPGNRR